VKKKLKPLIDAYNLLVKGIEQQAEDDADRAYGGIVRAGKARRTGNFDGEYRAYGGIVRAGKGALVESMARNLVKIAWADMEQPEERLSFIRKSIPIPLKPDYIEKIRNPEVAKWVRENIQEFHYGIKTDVHINIDGHFVCGVECKAYSENAMMKRILVDFTLLRQVKPELACVLFQLESQLTGDYSQVTKPLIFGSKSTHTLLSYFDVDLHIITLLDGERKVDAPIHKPKFYKELKFEALEKAALNFQAILKKWT
jgi:hypothetical protein